MLLGSILSTRTKYRVLLTYTKNRQKNPHLKYMEIQSVLDFFQYLMYVVEEFGVKAHSPLRTTCFVCPEPDHNPTQHLQYVCATTDLLL